ncbi:MAG: helix-turn-helix domain-containing protein [Blautia sp.]|nr:helix-turn-helix domain-containing protein [Blautia sp.]
MKLQQLLQSCLDDWARITGLSYVLLHPNTEVYLKSGECQLPSPALLEAFLQKDILCETASGIYIQKIYEGSAWRFILLIIGPSDSFPNLGQLAVCQVTSILTACSLKTDKNTFMQHYLQGHYSASEAYQLARQMHISPSARRVVILVEPRQKPDDNVIMTIRNIFSSRTKDFILQMDHPASIAVVRELSQQETLTDIEKTAHMLVDMLSTELYVSSWVSCSNPACELSELTGAYQEAGIALETGKIFYSERSVFSYSRLGIGRLIYQLPLSVCELFVQEIFEKEKPDDLDEETLVTIRTLFENNLNLSETSRQLYVHRNTLVYRFEKLQKRLGLDVRSFEDALTFKIGMMVVDYMKHLEASGEHRQ